MNQLKIFQFFVGKLGLERKADDRLDPGWKGGGEVVVVVVVVVVVFKGPTKIRRPGISSFFPKQVYVCASILEKIGWTRWSGWARIWPCWARWVGLAVGFGSGGRAGLGWVRIWLFVYGLHCTCLLHVFMMSLCLSSWVSQMCYLI